MIFSYLICLFLVLILMKAPYALYKNESEDIFINLYILLLLAQLTFYFPIGGFNLSQIISSAIVLFIGLNIILRTNVIKYNIVELIFIFTLIMWLIYSWTLLRNSESFSFLNKFLFYLLNYIYIKYHFRKIFYVNFINKIYIVNFVYLLQIFICKLINNTFSYYSYYGYISENDYFGYFNSPHPFAAMLTVLILINIINILCKKNMKINVILLILNEVILVLQMVRTFIFGNIIGLVLIIVILIFNSKYKAQIIKYIALFLLVLLVTSPLYLGYLSKTRLNPKFNSQYVNNTSGRFNIWQTDLEFFKNQSFGGKMLGNGISFSLVVNRTLLGNNVYAHNSLIDILLDNGYFGLLFYILAFIKIFSGNRPTKNLNRALYYYIYIMFFCGFFLDSILTYITFMSIFMILNDLILSYEIGGNRFEDYNSI